MGGSRGEERDPVDGRLGGWGRRDGGIREGGSGIQPLPGLGGRRGARWGIKSVTFEEVQVGPSPLRHAYSRTVQS